jgi:hypothetical protein
MSDLGNRARARAHHYFLNTTTHDLFIECAARIEQLEAALREIDRFEVHKKDVAGVMMQRIARAALDQKAST